MGGGGEEAQVVGGGGGGGTTSGWGWGEAQVAFLHGPIMVLCISIFRTLK